MVESPLTAADRCSDTQDLAVPGTPYSSRARSVARVETAISIRRGLPMYLGLTSKPLPSLPPIRYWSTAQGESFQLGGRGRSSTLRRASSSSANCCSACWRRTWLMVCFRERSEEHTSELQSPCNLVCRLLLEKKKQ